MREFIISNGRKYTALKSMPSGLWFVKPDVGVLPAQLRGHFTDFTSLTRAVRSYLQSKELFIQTIVYEEPSIEPNA